MKNSESLSVMHATAEKTQNMSLLIDAIPYAKLLGMKPHYIDDQACFILPAKASNVGNPTLPALHGGAIGGFMEMSATLHLMMAIEAQVVPKIVDFSIDFLRAARLEDSIASCEIVRQGRRLVNLVITATQGEDKTVVASARANFLID